MHSRALSRIQILQAQRRNSSTTLEVKKFPCSPPIPAITITLHRRKKGRQLTCILSPSNKKQSGRIEHNEPLPLLTLDVKARVQLGLRGGVRRPDADDPAERVGLVWLGDAAVDWTGHGLGRGAP